MKAISFKFTFIKNNAWNGIWTGEGKNYYKVLYFAIAEFMGDEIKKEFLYDFQDGWVAKVSAEIVSNEIAEYRQDVSHGFCGYEWMIDSIIINHKIKIKK